MERSSAFRFSIRLCFSIFFGGGEMVTSFYYGGGGGNLLRFSSSLFVHACNNGRYEKSFIICILFLLLLSCLCAVRSFITCNNLTSSLHSELPHPFYLIFLFSLFVHPTPHYLIINLHLYYRQKPIIIGAVSSHTQK